MTAKRKKRQLTGEDRSLWSRVAATVTPLHKTLDTAIFDDKGANSPMEATGAIPERTDPLPPYQVNASHKPPRQHGIDLPTRKKLAKGRLPIDATIDLHDLRQGDAHGVLLAFLHRAQSSGLRHVLVITGKGSSSGSDGVLKRSVPHWLATAPFRSIVSGHHHAARHHGGAGAYYIRLKRRGGIG